MENIVSGEESTTVEVVVETPEEPTPEPVTDDTTVVVVEDNSGGDAGTEVALDAAIDHEGRLTRLEDQQTQIIALLEGISVNQQQTQETAAVALDVAIDAEETANEALEGEQESPDEDVEPDKEHPFFRKWGGA